MLTEKNLQTTELIKSIEPNGILGNIFDCRSEEKEIIQKWLINGSPLMDETLEQEKKSIQINSHQRFQFQF